MRHSREETNDLGLPDPRARLVAKLQLAPDACDLWAAHRCQLVIAGARGGCRPRLSSIGKAKRPGAWLPAFLLKRNEAELLLGFFLLGRSLFFLLGGGLLGTAGGAGSRLGGVGLHRG